MGRYEEFGPTILRTGLGFLFLIPGFDKLVAMLGEGHMIADMIGVSGAWVLLLAEIIFGIAILAGWKLHLTTIPLMIIMAGAIYTAVLPQLGQNPMAVINLLFHLLAIFGLVSLAFTGPGEYSVEY